MWFCLWQRSFLKTLIYTFFFQLSIFYFLFVLVDLATNSSGFVLRSYSNLPELTFYYLYQFLRYLDIFLPLSFLLSTIYLLIDKRNHGELCALLSSGVSLFRLFLPFFYCALILASILYVNYEKGIPDSLTYTQSFQKKYSKHPEKKKERSFFAHNLEDGSKLIFRKYESTTNTIIDAFWLVHPKEIWHIKSILLQEEKKGLFADHFVRNSQGFFEKKESQDTIFLPSFTLQKEDFFLPIEFQPLSALYTQIKTPSLLFDEDIAPLYTYLYLRIMTPFLLFLIPLACFPFCLQFGRKAYTFRVFSLGLCAFIFFQTVLSALIILSENSVLSPFWCMIFPFLLSFFLLSLFYLPKKKLLTFSLKRNLFLSIF